MALTCLSSLKSKTATIMNVDSKVQLTAIIAVEDDGRNLRSCLDALSRWVTEILIVCPQGQPMVAGEYEYPVLYHDSSDVRELWEAGIGKRKSPWCLLVRGHEVVTGQLRKSIVEKAEFRRNDSCAFSLSLVSVFLKKRLKYPLQWTGGECSRLVYIAENSSEANLSGIRLEEQALAGELISYGDETLVECGHRALARAETLSLNLYRQNPSSSAFCLLVDCAVTCFWGFFSGYFLRKGFKEGWEGLVFNLADQATNIFAYLRYYEKYLRDGREYVARYGSPRRILVVKLRDIGDNVLATPLCKSIKQSFPQASLSVLSWSYSLPVFENNPNIDKLYGLSKNAGPEEVDKIVKQLSALDFDIVMNLHAGGFSSRLIGKIKARCRINNNYVGRDKYSDILVPTSDYYRSSVQRDLDCLRSLGEEPAASKPEIFLADEEIRWARSALAIRGFDLGKEIIVIHPTASVEIREWGMERFGQLIARIKTRHDQVLAICTDAEYPRVEPLARAGVQVFHSITVRQMMALIHESDLVVDNDSALSHIATAFNVPTLVLFSQAVREIFRPYDPEKDRHWTLYRDVHCRECKLDYCSHKACLDFTVDEVFEKYLEIIKGSQ
jgi:ADP-heptose:LPS heptosyltransferase